MNVHDSLLGVHTVLNSALHVSLEMIGCCFEILFVERPFFLHNQNAAIVACVSCPVSIISLCMSTNLYPSFSKCSVLSTTVCHLQRAWTIDTATWCMYSACMVKVGHFERSNINAFQNDVTSHATNYIPKRDGHKYKHTYNIYIHPQTESVLRD